MSSPKKRGEGTSCHHCKKRIRPNEMLKCTRGEVVPTNSRKRKRPCVKKYCLHCIKTFYSTQYLHDNNSGAFICPACRDECRCAACRRRVMKAKLKTDGSALQNEAEGRSHGVLESQTPDATNIEEGQVNGLLEILDSRPDVQDIIRRGMAMDFADDNAKILYVGHLIDQALTRPDVLALYYASSHGRTNNCRIKTEDGDGLHGEGEVGEADGDDDVDVDVSVMQSFDLPPETIIGNNRIPMMNAQANASGNGNENGNEDDDDDEEDGDESDEEEEEVEENGKQEQSPDTMQMATVPMNSPATNSSSSSSSAPSIGLSSAVKHNNSNGKRKSSPSKKKPSPLKQEQQATHFPVSSDAHNGLSFPFHNNTVATHTPATAMNAAITIPFSTSSSNSKPSTPIPLNRDLLAAMHHDNNASTDVSHQNSSSSDDSESQPVKQQQHLFPINVTPSAMMGGPTLASM